MRSLRYGVAIALLLSAAVARAEPAEPGRATVSGPEEARRADAKARYEAGVDAYSSGHFKDAVDHFLAADKLSPSAPLSFNIARAYEKLGDDSGALSWYRDYLRRAPEAPNAKDVSGIVRRFEARLAKKGVQQLSVLSTPAGATVSIDAAPVGVTPGTFDLAPGAHHVVLMLRGFEDVATDLELAPDHARDLSIELTPAAVAGAEPTPPPSAVAPAAAPSTPPKKPENSPRFGVWPWVVLGAGGATLGGALTFELLRQSAEKDAEREPTQVGFQPKLATMESRRTAARILTGVGGALVVTGGVLVALDLFGRKNETKTSLVVGPAPGGFGPSLAGKF